MKRSPDEKYTLTGGSLADTFRQSNVSFQKRINVHEHTVKVAPRVFTYIYSLPTEKDL